MDYAHFLMHNILTNIKTSHISKKKTLKQVNYTHERTTKPTFAFYFQKYHYCIVLHEKVKYELWPFLMHNILTNIKTSQLHS
jgi:hypothetical protein